MIITSSPLEVGSSPAAPVIAMLLLAALLIAKETSISVPWRQNQTVSRILDIGIVPLLIVSGLVISFALVRLLA
jgi:hypothetical protein